MTEKLRVLVVDDEAVVRSGLVAVLRLFPDLDVVGEASDGVEVFARVRELRPDVVLMDVRMPRIDGIEATRLLRAREQQLEQVPRVLVLTTFGSDEYVYRALRAGADGFLLKRAEPAEIAQAVRTVARGDSILFPASLRSLLAATVSPTRSPQDLVRRAGLTGRETEVLEQLVRGYSNREIAAELYLGAQTVKTYVASLLGKLGARDRTQAVIAAYEAGFVTPTGQADDVGPTR